MITRSFANGFEVSDYTEEVSSIPNQWGTIGTMGLFSPEPVAEHVVVFEETIKDGALIVDRVRGDRATVGKDAPRKLHTFAVPHFPYDDYISPQDIQGKRAYGSSNVETLDAVRLRKMERIRQNHAWTKEAARAQAICLGTAYAPSGTVVQNWNTEFSVTRKTVDFVFGTGTTEVNEKINEGIAHIQDNANGESFTGTVVLCSPEWFSALIGHATMKSAYTYYSSAQEPLRQRLGGASAMHRRFEHGGTTFIEMRDSYNGTRLITAGKAFMLPTGTSNVFKTYYSPANRFGLVNTLGEEVYLFESAAPNGTQITLESESNFINAILRPQMIVEFYTST